MTFIDFEYANVCSPNGCYHSRWWTLKHIKHRTLNSWYNLIRGCISLHTRVCWCVCACSRLIAIVVECCKGLGLGLPCSPAFCGARFGALAFRAEQSPLSSLGLSSNIFSRFKIRYIQIEHIFTTLKRREKRVAMAQEPAAEKKPKSFEALTPELSSWILDFAQSSGFARTTPVQAMAIPLLMGNKDLVVEVSGLPIRRERHC